MAGKKSTPAPLNPAAPTLKDKGRAFAKIRAALSIDAGVPLVSIQPIVAKALKAAKKATSPETKAKHLSHAINRISFLKKAAETHLATVHKEESLDDRHFFQAYMVQADEACGMLTLKIEEVQLAAEEKANAPIASGKREPRVASTRAVFDSSEQKLAERLLTAEEAWTYLRKSERAFRDLVKQPGFPIRHTGKRKQAFRRSELDRWVNGERDFPGIDIPDK